MWGISITFREKLTYLQEREKEVYKQSVTCLTIKRTVFSSDLTETSDDERRDLQLKINHTNWGVKIFQRCSEMSSTISA